MCNVAITLDMQPEQLRLRVADDGNGFDPSGESYLSSRHLGLTSMRERAAEIGGTLELGSQPGQGTEVIVVVPRNR
jgi:signal transduction histidine kinase